MLASWPTNLRCSHSLSLARTLRGLMDHGTTMELGAVVQCLGVKCTTAQLQTMTDHMGGTVNLSSFLFFMTTNITDTTTPECKRYILRPDADTEGIFRLLIDLEIESVPAVKYDYRPLPPCLSARYPATSESQASLFFCIQQCTQNAQ